MASRRTSEVLLGNTFVSLAQIGLTIAAGLISTRLMLRYLGEVDFGLLSVLGASGFYTALLTNGLNVAALRHMAYELGRGEDGRLREVVSSTVAAFVAWGLLAAGLGLLLRDPILELLTIPPERLAAAQTVYYTVVVGTFVSAAVAPFYGLRQAHQHLGAVAGYQLTTRLLNLGVLVLLPYLATEALTTYAIGSVAATVAIALVVIGTTYRAYPAARPRAGMVEYAEVKRILSFAQWSTLSALALQLRQQVALVLVNIYFGPVANGAYAIAGRISSILQQLQGAVHRSVQPAMTTGYAEGSQGWLGRMNSIGSRYAVFAILPLAIPGLVCTREVLTVWLGEFPEQTVLFARLLIGAIAVALCGNGYGMALNATDRVREGVAVFIPVQLVGLGLAVALIQFAGFDAWVIPASALVALALQVGIYAVRFGPTTQLPAGVWARTVLAPIAIVAAVAVAATWLGALVPGPAILRLAVGTVSCWLALAVGLYGFGMSRPEREVVVELIKTRLGYA